MHLRVIFQSSVTILDSIFTMWNLPNNILDLCIYLKAMW